MTVRLLFENQALEVQEGITLAAALAGTGPIGFRYSVSGEPRAAFCGMGTCFECRVTVDGIAHQRACQIIVRDGMEVRREG